MAEKKQDDAQYKELKRAVSENCIGCLYVFHGEERYLLEYYLGEVRKKLVSEGMEEFNHHRFEGKTLSISELSGAIDALPVFSERTLIEVSDFDFSRLTDDARTELLEVLSDLPEYVCLVFVYDTIEFKLDARIKINQQIKKLMSIVEFRAQDKSDLTNWIFRRFKALGKRIDRDTAEYLAFISGGLMTGMLTEIEKTAAYARDDAITHEDIDAVVTPVLDAVAYKMTDAIAARRFDDAMSIMSDLLDMNEPPHKILYSISKKLRQLLAARVCFEEGHGERKLMEICDIRFDFQARSVMSAAKKLSMDWCVNAVRLASETALRMNSARGANYAEQLTDLILKLAVPEGTK